MKLSEFLQLSHESQLDAAERAVCIGGRKGDKLFILLYQLAGFYIEIYYDRKGIRIVDLFAFDDLALLDPYLQKIKLPLLL